MMLDPRGPRFGAWITTGVLVAALATAAVSVTAAGFVVLAQALVFALGAARPRLAPYPLIFRIFVAPRLEPPAYREPVEPVRFAQGVGFVFAAVAAAGYLGGLPLLGTVAAAAALLAAFLNAAFDVCLACKVYPLVRLYLVRRQPHSEGAHP